jgi:hypothetical protein
MESDIVVKFEDLLFGESDFWASAVIVIVGIGNYGVETVIAASHLQNDENAGVASVCDLRRFVGGFGLEHGKGVGKESGNGPGERAAEHGGAQEFAAGFKSEFVHILR